MSELIQLVYSSRAAEGVSLPQLTAILREATTRNPREQITGMLVHSRGQFIQVLEGPPAAVKALFASIGRDPRHSGVKLLLTHDSTERNFANWSMGFFDCDQSQGADPCLLEHVLLTNAGVKPMNGKLPAAVQMLLDFAAGKLSAADRAAA